ncbi:MAG: threonine synthase [Gaiellales bacterium]
MAGLIERFRDRLPVGASTPIVTLGEGSTPMLAAPRLGAELGVELYLKLEGDNPTGSFKDRGMTLALSKAVEDGAKAVVCASTGNTSASAAAYAARAGLRCSVVVPAGRIALGKLAQAQACGARVVQIDGSFDDALAAVRELADRHPVTLVNNLNPYRLEGQKTAAFEVVEDLGDAPDRLCLPIGNGGNIAAYWRGFRESLDRGDATHPPRLLGCQAAGAAPLVHGSFVDQPETIATAIRIGRPVRYTEAKEALTRSEGAALAVSDDEILSAFRRLPATEGVFCEPASAASLAGLVKARAQGLVEDGARVVLVLTGHGLKDPDTAVSQSTAPLVAGAGYEAVEAAILGD